MTLILTTLRLLVIGDLLLNQSFRAAFHVLKPERVECSRTPRSCCATSVMCANSADNSADAMSCKCLSGLVFELIIDRRRPLHTEQWTQGIIGQRAVQTLPVDAAASRDPDEKTNILYATACS